MNKKLFQIENFKKEINQESFYITGYANNKDIADDYGDIPTGDNVYDLQRYNKNPVILADHSNSVNGIIGTMVSLKEDSRGLKFKALLMQNPKTETSAHAIQAIKEGHLRALSIGGKWFYDDKKNSNILTKAKIYEISFVAIPADGDALTDASVPKKQNNNDVHKKDLIIEYLNLLKRRKKMDLQEFIEEKMNSNVTEKEIIMSVLEEYENIEIEDICEKILNLKEMKKEKNNEKQSSIKQSITNEKIENNINRILDEKLKKININSGNKFKTEKKLKRFNTATNKFEERIVNNEAVSQFNNMLKLISEGDKKNAKAISNEIDQDNKFSVYNGYKIIQSDVAGSGGYAIPTEVNDEIMQLEYEKSVMLPHMNKDSIIYEEKIYPVMYGLSASYINSQDAAINSTSASFTNPTVYMERIGLWADISNTILRQKGIDLTQAFSAAVSSTFAEFLDLHIVCGNITGDTDLIDGLVWDNNSKNNLTPVSLSTLSLDTLKDIKDKLSVKINKDSTSWICNYKVADQIGLLKSGDNYIFNGYVEGRTIKPFGFPIIINPQIPNELQVAEDRRTGGTDSVLLCVDLSKVVIGLSDIRIDESQHFKFTHDVTTFRAIRNYGQKVLMSDQQVGTVCVAQELN